MKIRTLFKKGYVRAIGIGSVAASALALPTFATETSMVEVMTGSFTTMISEMMAAIAAILPITLTLVGASLVVAFGIKWFKKIVGKA